MRTLSYSILLILALLLATFVGVLAYITYSPSISGGRSSGAPEDRPPQIAAPSRPVISSQDPLRGDPNAPITIVEFGDFLCPACAQMEEVLTSVLEQYKGKVKLIWKDLPNTRIHPLATRAALSARCAQEQGAFWKYHDALLAQQNNVDQGLSPDVRPEGLSYFATLARELNLNTTEFDACLSSGRASPLLDRTLNEALLLKVDATPYFFIGTKRISGAVSEALLKDAIEKML